MDAVSFAERQRFRQPWVWLVLLPPFFVLAPILAFGLHQQLVLGKPFGNQPMSDAALVVTAIASGVVMLLVLLLLWWSELQVEVDSTSLHVRYRPFHRSPRVFALRDVTSCEAREYDPIGEFGGWGLRKGWHGGSGWAYNVSGSRGVQLEFSDGRRLLIGSQRSEELAAAIRRGMTGA